MSNYEIYIETSRNLDAGRDCIESFTIMTSQNSTKILVDEQVLAKILLKHLRVNENLEYYLFFPLTND